MLCLFVVLAFSLLRVYLPSGCSVGDSLTFFLSPRQSVLDSPRSPPTRSTKRQSTQASVLYLLYCCTYVFFFSGFSWKPLAQCAIFVDARRKEGVELLWEAVFCNTWRQRARVSCRLRTNPHPSIRAPVLSVVFPEHGYEMDWRSINVGIPRRRKRTGSVSADSESINVVNNQQD